MSETWRKIKEFPNYSVSNLGRVRTDILVPGYPYKYMKSCWLDSRGYHRVSLKNPGGRAKNLLVHRLVARAFLPTYFEDLVVNHMDGNPDNNWVNNLECVTQKENALHSSRRLGSSRIWKRPGAKLTPEQVLEIREAAKYRTSTKLYKNLAWKYRVRYGTILKVVHRKSWKHL